MKLTRFGGDPTSAKVGFGMPTAVTLNELVVVLENVVALALVKDGAADRDMLSVAVSGASVGIVVTPHWPSASTAAAEAELRLMTYELFVAFAEGAMVKVANRILAAPATGEMVFPTAVTVAPKSATVTGAVTIDNGNCATSLFKS